MNSKSAVLSGVAAAAILIVAGSAALAQSTGYDSRYGNGPAQSTPAEMQETNQLNQQGINGTTQSPAVLNGESQEENATTSNGTPYQPSPYQAQYSGPTPQQNAPMSDEGPYAPRGNENQYPPASASGPYGQQSHYYANQAQYAQPDAQYGAQEQQYQDQMQNYQGQQQRYRYERQRYNSNVRAYDLAQYAWSYPQPYAYHYGDEYGLQPLYLMAEPSQQLGQAPVEGPGGRWVGRVRNVQ
ncbi:MAG: hypothetical protein ACREHV_05770, partial [Rhizomicrobium sp.]